MLEKERRPKKKKTKTFGPWAKKREGGMEGGGRVQGEGGREGERERGGVLSSSGRAAAPLACWAVSKTRV